MVVLRSHVSNQDAKMYKAGLFDIMKAVEGLTRQHCIDLCLEVGRNSYEANKNLNEPQAMQFASVAGECVGAIVEDAERVLGVFSYRD